MKLYITSLRVFLTFCSYHTEFKNKKFILKFHHSGVSTVCIFLTNCEYVIDVQLPPMPTDKYSSQLIKIMERMMCRETDKRPSATELLQDVLFKKHKVPQVRQQRNYQTSDLVLNYSLTQAFGFRVLNLHDSKLFCENLFEHQNLKQN